MPTKAAARRLGLAVLLLVSVGLGWAYWPTLGDVAQRWWNDPQYSHGFLVPVFALAVLWSRREQFASVSLALSWWGVAFLAAAALLRTAGVYLYFHWLDGFSLLLCLLGFCVLLGGWAALRWAWPALALTVFMLPAPYQLEVALAHPLQRLATVVSAGVLQMLGYPALAEGNVIVLGELRIGVIEACSGLGMLFTFFALSTTVAFLIHRPLMDRVVIFLSAVPIAIAMNVLRIAVTAVLHVTAGSAVANAVFHDLAGWLMMPLALGVLWLELKLLGRLLREPGPSNPLPLAWTSAAPSRAPRMPAPAP